MKYGPLALSALVSACQAPLASAPDAGTDAPPCRGIEVIHLGEIWEGVLDETDVTFGYQDDRAYVVLREPRLNHVVLARLDRRTGARSEMALSVPGKHPVTASFGPDSVAVAASVSTTVAFGAVELSRVALHDGKIIWRRTLESEGGPERDRINLTGIGGTPHVAWAGRRLLVAWPAGDWPGQTLAQAAVVNAETSAVEARTILSTAKYDSSSMPDHPFNYLPGFVGGIRAASDGDGFVVGWLQSAFAGVTSSTIPGARLFRLSGDARVLGRQRAFGPAEDLALSPSTQGAAILTRVKSELSLSLLTAGTPRKIGEVPASDVTFAGKVTGLSVRMASSAGLFGLLYVTREIGKTPSQDWETWAILMDRLGHWTAPVRVDGGESLPAAIVPAGGGFATLAWHNRRTYVPNMGHTFNVGIVNLLRCAEQ